MSAPSAAVREDVEDVRVVDHRADVQVAELQERKTVERARQVADRQRPADDLQPMRFDAPGVEADSRGRGEKAEHGAAGHEMSRRRHAVGA